MQEGVDGMSETVSKYRAAKMLGVAERTVDRWVEEGSISAPEKDLNGRWQFDKDEIEKLAEARAELEGTGGAPEIQAAAVLREASAAVKSSVEAFRWLVEQQQKYIGMLSAQHQDNIQAWSAAIKEEATRKLETELAMKAEERKDKAIDVLVDQAPRIVMQGINARAGSKLLSKLSRLDDEQWDTVKAMAGELLDMTEGDVRELDEFRTAQKEQERQ